MSEDNIKVTVKVRPLIKREKDNKLTSQWRVNGNTIQHVDPPMEKFVFGTLAYCNFKRNLQQYS